MSPNRQNTHGLTSSKPELIKSSNTFMTTNQKFYDQSKESFSPRHDPENKVDKWEKTNFTHGQVLSKGRIEGVQWAGEFHPARNDFRRTKDAMGSWANV